MTIKSEDREKTGNMEVLPPDETCSTRAKIPMELSDLPPKQAALALLCENGVSTAEAGKILGYKGTTAFTVKTKINKLSLTNGKMVKSASKVIKNILDGNTWGSVKEIKDSTTLQAAQMVYDRFEPKVTRNENLNVNVDLNPIDLTSFRTRK